MPSTRETILQALMTALQTVSGTTVLRDAALPERVAAGGLVILHDGDPGKPAVTMSPLAYHWEHKAEVAVIVQDDDSAARATAFDTLVANIAAVLGADRTLGGLCDWMEPGAPDPVDLPIMGGQAMKAAIITVTLIYSTADPLG